MFSEMVNDTVRVPASTDWNVSSMGAEPKGGLGVTTPQLPHKGSVKRPGVKKLVGRAVIVGTHQADRSCWKGVGDAVVDQNMLAMPPDDTLRTSQFSNGLLNAVAFWNIAFIVVTRPVSHASIGWLNATASRNMLSIERTRPVSHAPIGWLKISVSRNMDAMLVAAPVFHPEMSRLNPSALLKAELKSVTRDTSQFSTPAKVPLLPANVPCRLVTEAGKAAMLLSSGWFWNAFARLVSPTDPKLFTAVKRAAPDVVAQPTWMLVNVPPKDTV